MDLNEIDKLESNSNRSRDEKERLKPVVQGKTTAKPASFGRKVSNAFMAEDKDKVKDYILFDLVIPGIRDTIVDVLTRSIEMIFTGTIHSKGQKGRPSGGYVSYDGYSRDRRSSSRDRDEYRATSYDDLYYETRADALQVLDIMMEQCSRFGRVSIADMYDASNITDTNYMHVDYGWTDLRGAIVGHNRNGFYLDLPRPRQIN